MTIERQFLRPGAPSLMPPLVRRWWALRLLRAGDHVAPLLLTDAKDAIVLSSLSMHGRAIDILAAGPARSFGQALAEVVSLAATGQGARAADLALARGRSAARRWRRRAALAIVPSQPLAALELIEGCDDSLVAALLARAGQPQRAIRWLAERGAESPDAKLLEAHLAARAGELARHQALVNEALAAFGLEPVARRNETAPLSVLNVRSAVGCHVDGPLVSVVMAVRDVERYVDAAIVSILSQTWHNLELIVVDDASTDATAARVERWVRHDPRLTLLRKAQSSGTYAARNAGLRSARGALVTFHDGDDWAHPQRIEVQAAAMCARPDLVASSSRWARIAADGAIVCRQVWPLIRWNPSSVMFRRSEVLSEIGFFDEVRTGADSELWARIRLAFGAARVLALRQPLSFGAWRADSLTNAPDTGFAERHWNSDRLAYWEAWHFWHAHQFAQGRIARLMPNEPRPFQPPAGIDVRPNKTETTGVPQ